MKRNLRLLILVVLLVSSVILILRCATVPITGRKQTNIIPESLEMSLGLDSYRQVLSESKISKDHAQTEIVKRVGTNIARVAKKPEFKWEFNLIQEDKTVNAFCLPGGKVAVYSGILPVTQSETGMAVVVGHEIAHAIARHGGERITQQLGVGAAAMLASKALEKHSKQTQDIVMACFGLGAQVGFLLPFSRKQETEADHIGLVLMAKAGYDPKEAIPFWQRMMQTGSAGVPEFLSTHPGHETRIKDLKSFMPEAMKYYKK